MTKKSILFLITSFLFWTTISDSEQFFADEFESSAVEKVLQEKLDRSPGAVDTSPEPDFVKKGAVPAYPGFAEKKQKKVKGKQKFIDINYNMAPLVQVVNDIAQAKGVNVALPPGITSTLSFHLGERVPVKKAWKLLYTILDIAGYALVKRRNGYIVERQVKGQFPTYRQPLPIYIGVAPDDLPDTDKKIQYLYYLANIQVPENPSGSSLYSLLSSLLTQPSFIKFLPQSNGILLSDSAANIKAAMKVVLELDKAGFKEAVEVVRLTHTSARTVANLFNTSIIQAAQRPVGARRRGAAWRGKSRADFFAPTTKIIPEDRTNSLIIVGTPQAINRVREFVFEYIDVKLDSGKSILHTYQLKYLDASKFKDTLQGIIDSQKRLAGATGQSRAAGKSAGPERFFEGVIIETDTKAIEAGKKQAYAGSNQLVIAARNDDWLRIKKLIDELDQPQPQVIIEVLVADLTLGDERILGTHTRTPASLNLPEVVPDGNLEFQSSQPGPAVANYESKNPSASSIHVDLMRKDFTYVDSSGETQTVDPLAGVSAAGSTVISLSDNNGNAWSLLQILQSYSNSKILSHPHVVATNNQLATVSIGEIRLVQPEGTIGTGGAALATKREVNADLIVEIVPRISGGKVVNMQVKVTLEEWIGETSDTRIIRKVETNANVKDSSVLALGGLIRLETNQGLNETPILGKIPIIGWLFKRRRSTKQKNNLTVFIRPTIVQPRLRGGIDKYTKDYIRLAKTYVKDGMLFDTLRDPITRWFFQAGVDPEKAIDVFAEEGMPDRIGSEMLIDADAGQLPIFRKNPRKTMLAAMEGRAQPDLAKVVPMPEQKFTVAEKENKPIKQEVVADKLVKVVQETHPETESIKSPEEVLDRDEQLKKLLSQFDNPLLSKR